MQKPLNGADTPRSLRYEYSSGDYIVYFTGDGAVEVCYGRVVHSAFSRYIAQPVAPDLPVLRFTNLDSAGYYLLACTGAYGEC